MNGLTPGRIVHYVADGYREIHVPAMVTNVFQREGAYEGLPGFLEGDVSLTLFWPPMSTSDEDQADDRVPNGLPPAWERRYHVKFDAVGRPGTWHWIEPA